MGKNYITISLFTILIFLATILAAVITNANSAEFNDSKTEKVVRLNDYWFQLNRKSKIEYLYQGVPGNISLSVLIREFNVNVGIENERPTPLPKLMGKNYWNIIGKSDSSQDPETAPYFLTLDIPWSDNYPFGPKPYNECFGQCNWVRPGPFGLHGVGGNLDKLTDSGSSGCIRHNDDEITYIYNLINPSIDNPIRYYVYDR